MDHSLVEKIHALLAKDQLLEAAQLLSDSPLRSIAVSLKGRIQHYQLQVLNGTLSEEQKVLQRNQLRNSLLQAMEALAAGDPDSLLLLKEVSNPPSHPNSKQETPPILTSPSSNSPTKTTSTYTKQKSIPTFTPILGFITVITLIGVVVLFFQNKNLSTTSSVNNKKLTQAQAILDSLQTGIIDISENGKFKLRNGYAEPITLLWWTAMYRDQQGKYVNFDVADYYKDGNFNQLLQPRLKPGQSVSLTHTVDQKMVYDGSVIYYAMLISTDKPGILFNYSGFWTKNAREGQLTIAPK